MKKLIALLIILSAATSAASNGEVIIDEYNDLVVKDKMLDKWTLPIYGNYYICTVEKCIEFKDVQKLMEEKGTVNRKTHEAKRKMLCYYQHELVN